MSSSDELRSHWTYLLEVKLHLRLNVAKNCEKKKLLEFGPFQMCENQLFSLRDF